MAKISLGVVLRTSAAALGQSPDLAELADTVLPATATPGEVFDSCVKGWLDDCVVHGHSGVLLIAGHPHSTLADTLGCANQQQLDMDSAQPGVLGRAVHHTFQQLGLGAHVTMCCLAEVEVADQHRLMDLLAAPKPSNRSPTLVSPPPLPHEMSQDHLRGSDQQALGHMCMDLSRQAVPTLVVVESCEEAVQVLQAAIQRRARWTRKLSKVNRSHTLDKAPSPRTTDGTITPPSSSGGNGRGGNSPLTSPLGAADHFGHVVFQLSWTHSGAGGTSKHPVTLSFCLTGGDPVNCTSPQQASVSGTGVGAVGSGAAMPAALLPLLGRPATQPHTSYVASLQHSISNINHQLPTVKPGDVQGTTLNWDQKDQGSRWGSLATSGGSHYTHTNHHTYLTAQQRLYRSPKAMPTVPPVPPPLPPQLLQQPHQPTPMFLACLHGCWSHVLLVACMQHDVEVEGLMVMQLKWLAQCRRPHVLRQPVKLPTPPAATAPTSPTQHSLPDWPAPTHPFCTSTDNRAHTPPSIASVKARGSSSITDSQLPPYHPPRPFQWDADAHRSDLLHNKSTTQRTSSGAGISNSRGQPSSSAITQTGQVASISATEKPRSRSALPALSGHLRMALEANPSGSGTGGIVVRSHAPARPRSPDSHGHVSSLNQQQCRAVSTPHETPQLGLGNEGRLAYSPDTSDGLWPLPQQRSVQPPISAAVYGHAGNQSSAHAIHGPFLPSAISLAYEQLVHSVSGDAVMGGGGGGVRMIAGRMGLSNTGGRGSAGVRSRAGEGAGMEFGVKARQAAGQGGVLVGPTTLMLLKDYQQLLSEWEDHKSQDRPSRSSSRNRTSSHVRPLDDPSSTLGRSLSRLSDNATLGPSGNPPITGNTTLNSINHHCTTSFSDAANAVAPSAGQAGVLAAAALAPLSGPSQHHSAQQQQPGADTVRIITNPTHSQLHTTGDLASVSEMPMTELRHDHLYLNVMGRLIGTPTPTGVQSRMQTISERGVLPAAGSSGGGGGGRMSTLPTQLPRGVPQRMGFNTSTTRLGLTSSSSRQPAARGVGMPALGTGPGSFALSRPATTRTGIAGSQTARDVVSGGMFTTPAIPRSQSAPPSSLVQQARAAAAVPPSAVPSGNSRTTRPTLPTTNRAAPRSVSVVVPRTAATTTKARGATTTSTAPIFNSMTTRGRIGPARPLPLTSIPATTAFASPSSAAPKMTFGLHGLPMLSTDTAPTSSPAAQLPSSLPVTPLASAFRPSLLVSNSPSQQADIPPSRLPTPPWVRHPLPQPPKSALLADPASTTAAMPHVLPLTSPSLHEPRPTVNGSHSVSGPTSPTPPFSHQLQTSPTHHDSPSTNGQVTSHNPPTVSNGTASAHPCTSPRPSFVPPLKLPVSPSTNSTTTPTPKLHSGPSPGASDNTFSPDSNNFLSPGSGLFLLHTMLPSGRRSTSAKRLSSPPTTAPGKLALAAAAAKAAHPWAYAAGSSMTSPQGQPLSSTTPSPLTSPSALPALPSPTSPSPRMGSKGFRSPTSVNPTPAPTQTTLPAWSQLLLENLHNGSAVVLGSRHRYPPVSAASRPSASTGMSGPSVATLTSHRVSNSSSASSIASLARAPAGRAGPAASGPASHRTSCPTSLQDLLQLPGSSSSRNSKAFNGNHSIGGGRSTHPVKSAPHTPMGGTPAPSGAAAARRAAAAAAAATACRCEARRAAARRLTGGARDGLMSPTSKSGSSLSLGSSSMGIQISWALARDR